MDRSRLEDRTPYLYRTRDYGANWQLITNGIADPAFAHAIREDTERKGLLFAGTAAGVYLSFDDGDHWQSLQLNLPSTSVRDLTVHGEDLVVATHGRSFWILDDITPLRQAAEAVKANAFSALPSRGRVSRRYLVLEHVLVERHNQHVVDIEEPTGVLQEKTRTRSER